MRLRDVERWLVFLKHKPSSARNLPPARTV
jgi:hypothetical protein